MAAQRESQNIKRKVILLVHGAGEKKRDAFLTTVANAFANWMDRRGVPEGSKEHPPQLEVVQGGHGDSSVELTFRDQRWKFTEVRWADAIEPPPFDPMIGWTFRLGWDQILNLIGFSFSQAVWAFTWSIVFLSFMHIISYGLILAGFLASVFSALVGQGFGSPGFVAAMLSDQVYSWSMRQMGLRLKNVDERHFVEDVIKTLSPGETQSTGPSAEPTPTGTFRGIVKRAFTVFGWTAFLYILMGFHFLNALTNILLYIVAFVLLVPLLLVFWLLAMVTDIPKFGEFVSFVKKRFESFLVGSLSEIKVFLDEPVQAQKIRRELERALDIAAYGDSEVYVLAHSVGAAIAYETLALNRDNNHRVNKVKSLITVGSALNLVRRLENCRSSFYLPLGNVPWVNIRARHDPLRAGPTKGTGSDEVVDVQVSNEGDPFNDHSGYWANEHQVFPRLVGEIWGKDANDVFHMQADEHWVNLGWLAKRKVRILCISGFRWAAWGVFPATISVGLASFFGWLGTGFLKDTWEALWQALNDYIFLPLVNPLLREDINVFDPRGLWQQTFAVLLSALIVTLVAQMLYKFTRALLWDGFFEQWFRIPKRDSE
ncbi:MAG: hypothetical protein BZY88_00055 [SAR202 cluster bacterium Io17-Chloro-G9]|nr:MAG: hypothetical protein BZY88_00055 [SAR202 cluster bacterium Io17-Chloro-G9]